MIYCTIGVPSRFSEWCESLLNELVSGPAGRPEQFIADGLDHVGRGLVAHNCLEAIVIARQPQASFSDALMAHRAPILVTLEEPAHAIADLMADHALGYAEAVRAVASSLAALVPIIQSGKASVVTSTTAESAEQIIDTLARHFGLTVDAKATEAAVRGNPFRAPAPPAQIVERDGILPDEGEVFASLRGSVHHLAECPATGPLWRHLHGEPLREIVWARTLFYLGDAPTQAPTGPIDLTGTGRCLLFGPYIRLPVGPWSCSIVFACSERAMGASLVADVFAGAVLNSVVFKIDEPGIFEVELSFVNSSPDHPIEVRLSTAEAAFEGEIMLGEVRMFQLKAKRLAIA